MIACEQLTCQLNSAVGFDDQPVDWVVKVTMAVVAQQQSIWCVANANRKWTARNERILHFLLVLQIPYMSRSQNGFQRVTDLAPPVISKESLPATERLLL